MYFSWDKLSQLNGQYEVNEIHDLFYKASNYTQRSKYIDNKEYKSLSIRISKTNIILVTNFDLIIDQVNLRYNQMLLSTPFTELKLEPYKL
jgi:hypothetical protein